MSDQPDHFAPFFDAAVGDGRALTQMEAYEAFLCIMRGEVSELKLAAFLTALKVRGETTDEIAGAVAAMRTLMLPATAPDTAIDIVGTGGDAKGTFNVSTAASFVLAGAGVPVAKHGNRSASSKAGSADVLEKLGVDLTPLPVHLAASFQTAGLAFLWAPHHHPAMKYAASVRQALKIRTIFNLLGPLCNPAQVKRQLIGTYAVRWQQPMAETMQRLGAHHVWVVHGADGMDELTTTGLSHVVELKDGKLSSFDVHPRDAGLPLATLGDLLGGSAEDNARSIRAILQGEKSPLRDIVLLNAAAALIIAGKVTTLSDGISLAAASIDSGHAAKALAALIQASQASRDKD